MRAPVPGPFRLIGRLVVSASLLASIALPFYRARATPPPIASVLQLKTHAEAGDVAAQIQLSELLLLGEPSDKSFDVALLWAREAAATNSSRAEFVLGYLYEHGRGVAQDYAKAAKYYEAAMVQGHRVAPNNLAALYSHGWGVQKDQQKAVELLSLSAERGDPGGQYNLGVAYSMGLGTARNPGEAAHWFRVAADHGFARAQRELGVLYFRGESVPMDYGQGAHWITLAAQQGEPAAEIDLGSLYETGRGVALDYIAAYTWYARAAAAGERSGTDHLKTLTQIMTRQQIERAKAMVSAEGLLSAGRTTREVSDTPSLLPQQ